MNHKQFEVATLLNVTAGGQSADFDTEGREFGEFFFSITSITGTSPTVTFTIQGKDPKSGTYFTLLATTALNANGLTRLRVGPGLPVTANLSANDLIPNIIRVTWTLGGTVTDLDATIYATLSD